MKNINITNNTQQQQFEVRIEDNLAVLVYRFYKNDIAFMHTEVPESMSGKGIASSLAEYAFKFAQELGKPVMVYCPFVAGHLKRHPELREQLDKEYHH